MEITRVLPADKGGPDTLDVIEGRVTGAQPGQRIVLFSKSRVWWVQPEAKEPFTEIRFSGYEWIVRAAPSDRGGTNAYDREVEVLREVAGGNRNRDIAERLFISEETVKVHVKHVMEKLGASDRTEAVAIALRRGIIEL